MTAMIKSIHNIEEHFDRGAERFAFHHPYLAFLAMFLLVPVFILLAVSLCTVLVMLPAVLLLGWV